MNNLRVIVLPSCNKKFYKKLFGMALRTYSVNNDKMVQLPFLPRFSTEEQEKILNVINQSAEQLSRFQISANRIKSVEAYKNKKGPFQSLSEILEVEGLGMKILEQMCENIVNDKGTNYENQTAIEAITGSKRIKNLISPSLTEDRISSISSAVSIHIGPTGMSWAKLDRTEKKLKNWGFSNFASLPLKMLPTDTFNLAMNVLTKIPVGDIYILEANGKSLQGQNQTSVSTQQLEFTSMLLALINTSLKHNLLFQNLKNTNQKRLPLNVVHFLKFRLSARLFKTLLGNERISTVQSVTELLTGSEQCSLPCSQIVVEKSLLNEYNLKSSPSKELLGHALMLIVTFMDIVVYKNPTSINALTTFNNKK